MLQWVIFFGRLLFLLLAAMILQSSETTKRLDNAPKFENSLNQTQQEEQCLDLIIDQSQMHFPVNSCECKMLGKMERFLRDVKTKNEEMEAYAQKLWKDPNIDIELQKIQTTKIEKMYFPKNYIDNLPKDLLQICESYLTPEESLNWKQTNQKNMRLTITGFHNIFKSDRNIRVSRNVQNQDDIRCVDPQNLISMNFENNVKNLLRNCLRLPENQRSNYIYDEVAEWTAINWHASQYQLLVTILLKVLGKLDDERKKACRVKIFRKSIVLQNMGNESAMKKFVEILKKENKLDDCLCGDDLSEQLTPLTWTAFTGDLKTVKTLLDAKAEIDATAENGDTALMFAALSGNLETVKFLLGAKANINKTDDNGDTALMRAARSFGSNLRIVNYLLNKNAMIDIKNKQGETAAQIAKKYGYKEKERAINDFMNL